MNSKIKTVVADALLIALGSVMYGISVVVFSAPNHIAPGGVTGLATLTQYLWGWPIGTVSLLVNLPLLLAGWQCLGRPFLYRTLAGTVLSSVFTDLLDILLPAYIGHPVVVCLLGGALCGFGLGLILKRGGTTGGSEITARLLELKFTRVPIGKLVLVVDGVVILLSGAVYKDVGSMLYAVLFAVVSAVVTDWLIYGLKGKKTAK